MAANVVAAQSQNKELSGTLTIKSAGRSTAVHGKSADPKVGEFLFCIDQEAGAKPVTFNGEGRVLYRSTPVAGMPESLAGKSPEPIAPVLTVITSTGETWLFAAKGQAALPPPAGAARSTTIPVNMVRRTDWSTGSGPRRGTDISSCLMTAG
jgi:hypothetical protein